MKHPIALLLSGLLLLSYDALAAVYLETSAPVLGEWTLEAVAPKLEAERIPENRIWEFRNDGKIITHGYNRHFKTNDRQEFKYTIQSGKIVADWPGRAGKTLRYEVYELDGDRMILKGGLEGYYFFNKN